MTWRWVKGHSGNRGNEETDKLADRGAQGHDEWDVDEPGPEEEMDHFLEGSCAEFWAAMSPRREQTSEPGDVEEETRKPSWKELSTTYAGCAERVVGRKVKNEVLRPYSKEGLENIREARDEMQRAWNALEEATGEEMIFLRKREWQRKNERGKRGGRTQKSVGRGN